MNTNTQALTQKANEYISLESDEYFRSQVEKLLKEENWVELNDRFYTDLAFGTGGLRGVIGGGYNRMNSFTVRRATQGLANYIVKAVPVGASAVIAYDSRNFSDHFALQAALVFCANGIKTYLFTGLRPTPELSFAVRRLKATAGIVVTASHNPPEYNGYKVYWDDGAQVVAPHDAAIIKEVLAAGNIKAMERDEAISSGRLVMIDREVDVPFIDMVKSCAIRPKLLRDGGKDIKVVFTPLHGTGGMAVETALKEMGVDIIFVDEQKEPNGNFPTVDYPNPEEASAMKLALDLGEKVGADLILGTDPDADRLGIAAPGDDGKFVLITGNQLGALLADYILSARKEMGTMPAKPAFIKTIVTTELQRLIAEDYGAACFDVLTGFKYIGEKIREFEAAGADGLSYIFGGEESYGYLANTEARDKDAISAATMTVEMALYHKSEGRTLLDQLRNIWKKHGYFQEALISKTFKGESGLNTMKALMEKLRSAPPKTFGGLHVAAVKDYSDGTTLSLSTNSRDKNIDLPSSNVLQFILDDGSIVTVRPSGTEPKIKFYVSCTSKCDAGLDEAVKAVSKKIDGICAELEGIA
ncbi:MAG: phospho-sugar mutase [Chitinispirillales bacterium]|jgi:phosphoglucomutase|nr:phospho-sugar mutase [Chitinispirillales bacterium]